MLPTREKDFGISPPSVATRIPSALIQRFNRPGCLMVVAVAYCLAMRSAMAGEAPAADLPPEQVIDQLVEAQWLSAAISPAPDVDDSGFLRRVTLDLAGRIPLASEAKAFLLDGDPAKRVNAVDRLLSSTDFAFQQRNEFNTLLMPADQRQDGEFRDYLLKAFQENRPWSRMFQEMLTGREDNPDERPALAFLKKRVSNLDDLTNDTTRLFFGVSISCAKCHDHPLVDDWKQDHYYGMASFFSRTWVTKKNFLAEREFSPVGFKTTAGEEKQARLLLLSGTVVDEPPQPQLDDQQKKELEARRNQENEQDTPPAAPPFSPRAKLVDAALQGEMRGFLSRSLVNRVWASMLGRGLVEPMDQMHSGNPASHPELLDWLARDLETHGYDIKRLIRAIAVSKPYARASRWEGAERPDVALFAVGSVRPLSPLQYSLSLTIATLHPDQLAEQASQGEQWINRRRDHDNHAQGFANQIETPGENFQVSVSESLLFSNGQHVQNEYLRDGGDRLLAAIKSAPDVGQGIELAFWSILSRQPDPEERQRVVEYLAARADRPDAGWQQVLWALLGGGEFRFNY